MRALLLAALFLFIQSCKRNDNNRILPATYKGDTITVTELITKANSYLQTDFDSMRFYANEAYKQATTINYVAGMARAKAIEANYQRRKGNYPEAIATGLEVIKVFDSLRSWTDLVRMKNMVADFYKEMGGEKNIPEYQRKGLDLSLEAQALAEKENYNAGIVTCLNQQGIILRDMSKTTGRKDLMDSAFDLYSKGIKIIKESGEGEDMLGKLYNNISQIYNEHYKDYHKALEYQMEAVDYNSTRNNQTSLTHNYNTISEIYINLGDLEQANNYALKMLEICRQIKAPFRMVNAFGVLTAVNKKMGRFDSALYYTQQRYKLSDSLNNLERSNQIAEMQTRYETGLKDAEITDLQAVNEIKTQRFWLLAGGSLVLLLLLAMVWMQKKKSQKQQKLIAEQSERLQWMMKELHHRVKNNLQIVSSLLNLQSYRLNDEESVSAIRESQLRVQAMSLMHQRLYQVDDVSMVNFKLYSTDLAETLMKAYGYQSDEFDLMIRVDKEMLEVDTVMPMGLLVNEIITNSFKYAYKDVTRPALHISLSGKEKGLELEIKDNGPGISESKDTQHGFGQKLIAALSKQLSATYTVSNLQGTCYTFNIPYQREKAA